MVIQVIYQQNLIVEVGHCSLNILTIIFKMWSKVYFSEPVIKISALGETKQIMAYLEQWQADYGQDTSLTIYNSVDYSGVDFIPPTSLRPQVLNMWQNN